MLKCDKQKWFLHILDKGTTIYLLNTVAHYFILELFIKRKITELLLTVVFVIVDKEAFQILRKVDSTLVNELEELVRLFKKRLEDFFAILTTFKYLMIIVSQGEFRIVIVAVSFQVVL